MTEMTWLDRMNRPGRKSPTPKAPLIRLLQEERMRQGLPANCVALKAGYDETTVQCWERGRSSPRMQAFIDVVNALGGEVVIRLNGKEILA